MNKVVLLDRDGIINQDSVHYIKSVEEFIPIPESLEAIARLHQAGYRIGVATNQSGVSRGYYTEEVLQAIHARMKALIGAAGGEIAAVEYCIHLPESGCFCRKPQPGMLLKLAAYFDVSPKKLVFIGDRVSDIQAAQAAGMSPVMVLSPMTDRGLLQSYPQVPVYSSLAAWVDDLVLKKDE